MEYIAHHGIKGQKWGIRRFQNPDGTLTEAGKAREREGSYNNSSYDSRRTKRLKKAYAAQQKDIDSYNSILKTGAVSKSGKVALTSKDAKNLQDSLKAEQAKTKAKLDASIEKDASKREAKDNKKLAKEDAKWEQKGHSKNLWEIEENATDKISEWDYKNQKDYVKALTKELNAQASKLGTSPSGKKKIQYGESAVKYSLEEYGNLDYAYSIVDKKK